MLWYHIYTVVYIPFLETRTNKYKLKLVNCSFFLTSIYLPILSFFFAPNSPHFGSRQLYFIFQLACFGSRLTERAAFEFFSCLFFQFVCFDSRLIERKQLALAAGSLVFFSTYSTNKCMFPQTTACHHCSCESCFVSFSYYSI